MHSCFIFNCEVSEDLFFVPVDVEECETGDACCSQFCINYVGGYECSCKAGFRLHPDGCGCEGKDLILTGSGTRHPRGLFQKCRADALQSERLGKYKKEQGKGREHLALKRHHVPYNTDLMKSN